MASQTIGTCQVCLKSLKVVRGLVVEHLWSDAICLRSNGTYERCAGSAEQPYEVSCSAIQPYIDGLQKSQEGREKRIKKLQNNEFTELRVVKVVKDQAQTVLVRRSEVSEAEWAGVVKAKISSVEYEVAQRQAIIDQCAKQIVDWAPAKLTTLAEIRAARAQARAAKRVEAVRKQIARDRATTEANEAREAALKTAQLKSAEERMLDEQYKKKRADSERARVTRARRLLGR